MTLSFTIHFALFHFERKWQHEDTPQAAVTDFFWKWFRYICSWMFTKSTVKWIIEGFKTGALHSHLLGLDEVFFNGKIVVHVSGSLIGRDPFNIILHPLDDIESLSCLPMVCSLLLSLLAVQLELFLMLCILVYFQVGWNLVQPSWAV